MKKLLALAGTAILLVCPRSTVAGTLFTNPVIYVAPMTLDFGSVPSNRTATATFIVENMGVGILAGKVTVPAPFKITSGATYSLKENETQIVTVTYKPSGAPTDKQTAKFTGGGEAKATVTGKSAPAIPTPPKRR